MLDRVKAAWKAFFAVKKARKEIVRAYKSGWKTTEFWFTLLVNVAAVLAASVGFLSAEWAAVVMGLSGLFYAISRGFVKAPVPDGKPAWKTSEVQLLVLQALVAFVGALQGVVSPDLAAKLAVVISLGMSASRSLAKQPATSDGLALAEAKKKAT